MDAVMLVKAMHVVPMVIILNHKTAVTSQPSLMADSHFKGARSHKQYAFQKMQEFKCCGF